MPILGHYCAFTRNSILNLTTEDGVYELFDGQTLFLGSSEGDPRGMRGRLERHLSDELEPSANKARDFRFEMTSHPKSRLEELLEEYLHEHGYLPRYNVPAEPVAAGGSQLGSLD